MYVVWDEFANGAKWDNIVNALTAGLSRGVRFCLVIQDFAQLKSRYGDDKAETIRSNCQNLYYLLAGEYSTLKDVSDLCGSKIIWNHNRQEKEMVPVFSTDALSKLSMGEAVIKRQRMNPSNPRLRSFNRYCFKLPETPDLPERRVPETPIFNLKEEYEKKKPVVDETPEVEKNAEPKDKEITKQKKEKNNSVKDKSKRKGRRKGFGA